MAEVLVIAEHRKAVLADVSLEMLSLGRRLADQGGDALAAVVVVDRASALAAKLACHADTVLVAEVNGLEHSLAEPYLRAVVGIAAQRTPGIVLVGHDSFGMELAPALAVALDAPLATDCSRVVLEEGVVKVRRSLHNGKVNAHYFFAPCETAIVTGRPGAFAVEEAHRRGRIQQVDLSLERDTPRKRFAGYTEPEVGEVDITKADVLVAVGRGIGDKANLEVAEELARALGGVLACSRPVVDYGWLPPAHQVGLSGKTVKPQLYLALGVSGAFQHVVGLRGSRMVVAINKDATAPIFADADYGLVGDVLEIVPLLTQRILEARR